VLRYQQQGEQLCGEDMTRCVTNESNHHPYIDEDSKDKSRDESMQVIYFKGFLSHDLRLESKP